MEQIGFIGAYDKKDLLLNIARVLTDFNKKVLIVDATTTQKLRYIVPRISNAQGNTYVSEYLQIDVALGFMNLNGIAQYLGQGLNYDYILVDTDNVQTFSSFMLQGAKNNFFVTSYDEYELQKGLEIFSFLQQPMEIYKIIYSSNISNKEDDYLNHLVEGSNVTWKKERIQFAETIEDRRANLENQLEKNIILKRFSATYKDSLEYLISIMVGDAMSQGDIKRVIRKM